LKRIFLAVLLLFGFSFGEVKITTTIKPLADIVKEVGKDKVNVAYIIPSSVNFHTYEYKPMDIKKVYESDLFIFIGYGEPNISSLTKNLKKEKLMQITNLKGIFLLKEEDHDEIHPAVWLDPENAKVIAKAVMDFLISKDKQNAQFYKSNYLEFEKKVNEILNYGRIKLSSVKNKYFVSYHYEFPYFVKRFNLIYLAEIEMGHGREPSPKHLIEVVQKIKRYNVKAIFTSKQFFNPKTANIVISQTGAKVIFLDSMGETGDYLNMMKYNIDKVYEGLNL
jgi:zinc transport system substrate-binding protein